MKKFAHVFAGKIVLKYEDQNPRLFGGPWAKGNSMEIPPGMDMEKVDLVDGKLTEVEPKESYAVKRTREYPPMADYMDGVVKTYSSDPLIQKEGQAQIRAYAEACLAVKAKYPKE